MYVWAMVLPMMCCLMSCSSSEDEPTNDYNLSWIYGTWDVTEAKGSPYDGRLSFLINTNQVSIFQDGIEVEDYWYVNENGVFLLTEKGDEDVSARCEILSLTETEAKLRLTDLKYGYGSYTAKMKKR